MTDKSGAHGESETTTTPSISSFFADPKISLPTFLRSIRRHKIKRFAREDEVQALELMATSDTDGKRLWALISQSSLPDPVDAWIWRAAQDRLSAVIGTVLDGSEQDATRLLGVLRDALARGLKAKDARERRRAENWLRIGICWLVVKRSLHPWIVAESLFPVLFEDSKRALQASRRTLQRGRFNEFKLAIGMVSLAHEMVKAAQAEREAEKQSAANVRHQLGEARSAIEDLKLQLTSAQAELAERSQAMATVQARLEAERQHWGHDLSETKAKQRVLLSERVAPLLSDAIDALEIEPPAPLVSLKRLKAVLSLIQGERS